MTKSAQTKPKLSGDILLNRAYQTDLRDQMLALEKQGKKPTVHDMIEAMRAKGNGPFVDNWPHLKKGKGREVPLKGKNPVHHEVSHLSGGFAHTPQQEFLLIPFNMALYFGMADYTGDELDSFKKNLNDSFKEYHDSAKQYQRPTKKVLPASDRDMAIYTAAGFYLREKCNQYLHGTTSDEFGVFAKSYAKQKKFCTDYAQTDTQVPIPKEATLSPLAFIKDAPYDLILLSGEPLSARDERIARNRAGTRQKNDMHGRGEWASIEAVATGLCKPEDTDYPNRLAAVKKALTQTGLYYDITKEKTEGMAR